MMCNPNSVDRTHIDGREATQHMLSYVNRTHDVGYTLDRRLEGGFQGGAWRVQDADGQAAVLKWSTNAVWGPRVQQAAPVIAAARRAGWPTPAWLVVGQTTCGYPYQIQELSVGTAAVRVDDSLIREATPILKKQRGLRPDTDQNYSRYAHRAVFVDGSGFQKQLRNHSATTAGLLQEIVDWTAPYRDVTLTTDDLVHGEFHPENIMRIGDIITALVDAQSVGKGSYLYDLATMLCHAAVWDGEPGSINRLLAFARDAQPGALEIVVGANVLGLVAYATAHHAAGADGDAARANELISIIRARRWC
jgi:hypothetical protein